MTKSPRLKVFTAAMGFYDTVVAAPSQKAALEAWGVHRNLFADGGAAAIDDPAAAAAALAHPGVVLRRPLGSTEPFAVAAAEVRPPVSQGKPAKPKPKPKPPPDRKRLDAAEAALRMLETEASAAVEDLAARRAALDEEERRQGAALAKRRQTLEAALQKARNGFRRAGGEA